MQLLLACNRQSDQRKGALTMAALPVAAEPFIILSKPSRPSLESVMVGKFLVSRTEIAFEVRGHVVTPEVLNRQKPVDVDDGLLSAASEEIVVESAIRPRLNSWKVETSELRDISSAGESNWEQEKSYDLQEWRRSPVRHERSRSSHRSAILHKDDIRKYGKLYERLDILACDGTVWELHTSRFYSAISPIGANRTCI